MIRVVRRHVHHVVHTYIIPHRKHILIAKVALAGGIILGYLRNARTQAPVTYAQYVPVTSTTSSGSDTGTGYQGISIPATGSHTGYQGIMIPSFQITHDRLTLSAQLQQPSISLLSGYGRPGLIAQIQIRDTSDQIIFASGIVVQSDASRSVMLPTPLTNPGSYHIQASIQSGSQSLKIQRSGMISIISTYTQPSQQAVTTVSDSSISESNISLPVIDIVSSEPATVSAQIPSPSGPSQGLTKSQEVTQEIVSETTSTDTLAVIAESVDAPETIASVQPGEIQTPSQIPSDEIGVNVPATNTDSSDVVADDTTTSSLAQGSAVVEVFVEPSIEPVVPSVPVPSDIADSQSP